MFKTIYILLFSIFFTLQYACVNDYVHENNDDKPNNDTIIVDNEKDLEVFETGLKGLSGICFNADSTAFVAVCDNGRVYTLSFQGKIIYDHPFVGSNDFEGVCYDSTKKMYIVTDEANNTIFYLNNTKLEKITQFDIPNAVYNKGIEGISYYNDILYAVNQESPTLLITYNLKTNNEIARKTLSFASFLSDVCYDKKTNSLWIIDSKSKKLYQCDTNGNLLATQSIDMISKAEGLAINTRKRMAWISCDETGKLYKIKLNAK
jgi:uncharacterized protein YjiK